MKEEELLEKYACNNLGVFIEQYLTCQVAYDLLKTQFKEIKRLKESEEYHRKGFAELHKRIEEAIEYIEENFTNEDETIWHEEIREIYSILKGDEKSE